ncbi:phosphoglucomutase/phosphomannomutase family protein [Membranihabitans maritimus]|uniref:phosphoglucomutase/phosphomannomutase family protein n=1 Tax=Membranihabitans maritimus TaxID=2904244 RepID=UPI001F4669F0|nr:phosphoglucomutase/phosphomannomutase family protein [Membranihabitans maritimus]
MKIKFGTDGWRAIIAKDYTEENLRRVAEGTAQYMKDQGLTKAVIGYDCRFGGERFTNITAGVLGAYGIHVILSSQGFSSTPMVSLAVKEFALDLGIVITASHNPPSYNGYKLKSSYGGPSIPSEIEAVENRIPDKAGIEVLSLEEMESKGLLEYRSLEDLYLEKIKNSFDLDLIRNSGLKIAYDAMYGAGQNIIRKLFPKAELLHCEFNPSFLGQAPEPIDRNLGELSSLITSNPGKFDVGLANDGDADRIGMYDEKGKFVDSHHLLLLLLQYMVEYKNVKDRVIITFSVTDKMKKLAESYGLEVEITKIGFKYIAQRMQEVEIVVAGEESGGIAISGHIPERDGIWIGLVIFEFMAKSGQSLTQLVDNLYKKVGAFTCDRDDLHISESQKTNILNHLKDNTPEKFGEYSVEKVETLDGYKFTFDNGDWTMIRPSGTEPVLRVYAQSESPEKVRKVLDAVHKTLNAL